MVQISVTDTQGNTRNFEAEVGLTLMENIRDNDFDDLQALCGGCCSCCTCHVLVDSDWYGKLPEPESDETDLVEDSDHFQAGESRLSCQIEVTDAMDGLKVTIAPED